MQGETKAILAETLALEAALAAQAALGPALGADEVGAISVLLVRLLSVDFL